MILDANGMSDIDYTGLQALRDLALELEQRGVTIGIARASHLVHHDLKHGALLDSSVTTFSPPSKRPSLPSSANWRRCSSICAAAAPHRRSRVGP